MDVRRFFMRASQRAFSVVELTTTLAVALVILTIAVPGFRTITGSSAVSAGINDMASVLHFARGQAIMSGVQVVLCPSEDGHSCSDSFHWHQGLIIFADDNENRRLDKSETVLRFHQPPNNRVTITSSAARKRLVFKASGMSPGSTATITVCDKALHVPPRALILSNPGRPRQSKTRSDGSPLVCS